MLSYIWDQMLMLHPNPNPDGLNICVQKLAKQVLTMGRTNRWTVSGVSLQVISLSGVLVY